MRALALVVNFALLVLVFYLGTIPGGPNVDALPGKDKLGHALAFGSVAVTQLWGFEVFQVGPPRFRAFGAALSATILGGALELVQTQLPARSADVFDLLADAVGAFVSVWVGSAFLRRVLAPNRVRG
jgi:VanZ family protein